MTAVLPGFCKIECSDGRGGLAGLKFTMAALNCRLQLIRAKIFKRWNMQQPLSGGPTKLLQLTTNRNVNQCRVLQTISLIFSSHSSAGHPATNWRKFLDDRRHDKLSMLQGFQHCSYLDYCYGRALRGKLFSFNLVPFNTYMIEKKLHQKRDMDLQPSPILPYLAQLYFNPSRNQPQKSALCTKI